MKSNGTVVVGGGIIGAMCAWYLNRAGHKVTLIDREQFGSACSKNNCGYISPSHVLPLTVPGVVLKSLKSMLSSSSPFYIRPRLSPSMWSWFLKFAGRCNERDMLEAAGTLHQLLQSSRQLYEELIEGEKLDCEWQKVGLLFVYQHEHEFHEFAKTNDMTRSKFGVSAQPIEGDQLVKFEPALKEGLGGAWYFDCDCHLRPDRLMSELRRKLEADGVQIIENTGMEGFVEEGGDVVAVKTGHGTIDGSRFVIATGALTPFLNRHLGLKIPIQPGKGYSITMPRPKICPKYPLIFEEHRVAITPMNSGYRIGSTMEFSGYDSSINPKRLALLKNSAEHYLREPYTEPIEEKWFGWRPMTWDSKPFIDRVPRFKNVWLATGHNMLGLSLGAVTGKLIAELINGETPHLDLQSVSLSRLGGRQKAGRT